MLRTQLPGWDCICRTVWGEADAVRPVLEAKLVLDGIGAASCKRADPFCAVLGAKVASNSVGGAIRVLAFAVAAVLETQVSGLIWCTCMYDTMPPTMC